MTLDMAAMDASLLRELPVGVFTLDSEGRVGLWSESATRLTGRPSQDVVGKPLVLLGGDFGHLVESMLEGAEARVGLVQRVCRLVHQDGRELQLLVGMRLRGEGRSFEGGVGSLTDLTTCPGLARRPAPSRGGRSARLPVQRMVGESAIMQEVARRLELAGRSDVTVLITGESGTGKELAAGAIHAASQRRNRPFLSVNCSAIPEPLLESELFGHVRGAFTGAVRDKVGLFQAAEGGTLFLDEVGDLSKAMQVKLLRAIQEREIRRVGDERSIRFDARIVSATNRDLPRLVEQGEYREDFFYRIRVFQIRTPALRERAEDIPLLVDHFVRVFNRLHEKEVEGLAPEALAAIQKYAWPGNIRQLRNAIEHAFVTVDGPWIGSEDLPPEVFQGRPAAREQPRPRPRLQPQEERSRILEALRTTNGKRAAAARLLGISRVTLWKKIRLYQLELGLADPSPPAGPDVAEA